MTNKKIHNSRNIILNYILRYEKEKPQKDRKLKVDLIRKYEIEDGLTKKLSKIM